MDHVGFTLFQSDAARGPGMELIGEECLSVLVLHADRAEVVDTPEVHILLVSRVFDGESDVEGSVRGEVGGVEFGAFRRQGILEFFRRGGHGVGLGFFRLRACRSDDGGESEGQSQYDGE